MPQKKGAPFELGEGNQAEKSEVPAFLYAGNPDDKENPLEEENQWTLNEP